MLDPAAPVSSVKQAPPATYDVAIVGAGFGGIGMAIRLKQVGLHDFVLIEQADDIGGTWRDNRYPGCACDIPANLYSFSFAPNRDWSRRYPTQAEIQAYLQDCVTRFGVRRHLRLGSGLQEAAFDSARSAWCLRLANGDRLEVRVLIVSVGLLHRPAIPAIEGLDGFGGVRFHSARWDLGAQLAGKRIAVIGTGASAIQFVPRIAEAAASLVLYQRTPSWILPKHDPPAGPMMRQVLRYVPLLRRVVRAWTYWTHEARAVGFVMLPRLMRAAERGARSHAKRQLADAAVREAVTPDYMIGCKRILLSNDFLPTLNRPNVTVVTEPIRRVTRDAVVTADGVEREADVLIFATGFNATEPLADIRIAGRDGVTLAEAWRGGMEAWLGLTVSGFPNLFLLGGPNTGLGHNSVVFMLEAQIGYVLRCLRLTRRRGAAVMEVRSEAQSRFNTKLRRWMERTVWLSGCRSWYLDRFGRNTTLWPGFSFGYWLRTRIISERDYWVGRRAEEDD
jgi:cation diffusion facilitator CzcD-associated flavoprotein CzcO